jgi:hypothetical protein
MLFRRTEQPPEAKASERLGEGLCRISLSVSVPSRLKKDKQATQDMAASTGADIKSVNVSKAPLNNPRIESARRIGSEARSLLDNQTMYFENGERIAPIHKVTELLRDLGKYESKFAGVVKEIREEMDNMLSEAPGLLGTLYDARDYVGLLSEHDRDSWIQDRFQFRITCSPLDTANSFIGKRFEYLAGEDAALMEKYRQEGMDKRFEAATRDLYLKLQNSLQRMVTQFQDAEPGGKRRKIYGSLLTEVQVISELLGSGGNFQEDPVLEKARAALDKMLAKCGDVKELREDDTLRREMKVDVSQIQSDLLAKMESKFKI